MSMLNRVTKIRFASGHEHPDNGVAPFEYDVVEKTMDYYKRATLDSAIESAKERIEEWDYSEDPHGYCHERPDLILLVEAAERWAARKT